MKTSARIEQVMFENFVPDAHPKKELPENTAAVQQWEYHIFEIKIIHSDEDRTERAHELNKMGAAGWEPVGTISGGSRFHEYLILKRPRT